MPEPPVVSYVEYLCRHVSTHETIQEQVHIHTHIPIHMYTTLILHHK